MQQELAAVPAQPCVWMCAGLVRYRLCSRDFDCEHCPLDAALRGELPGVTPDRVLLYRAETVDGLPADRWYSSGHTWVQPVGGDSRILRVGIDAFAASLIGHARAVRCEPFEHLNAHDPLGTIDLGIGKLDIGAPVSGRIMQHNQALVAAPERLIASPYLDGWLADIIAEEAPERVLFSAHAARRQLTLDLRRFRRNIAFRLLAATASGELADRNCEDLLDLRHIIAGDHYVDCVRDLVH